MPRGFHAAEARFRTCSAFLAAVLAVAATASACLPNSRDRLAYDLETLAAAAFSPDGPGGVVLVASDDRIILRRAYGMADLELGVAMRPENVLGTGSITKQFTAVAILQLVERGLLRLEDDVRLHRPDFQTGGRAVTIAQVLTHTSGMPNFVDRPDFDDLSRREHTVDQLLALANEMPWRFEPGTDFYYSDSGYILLGAIIERVAGTGYGDYLESRIFRPLGMADTWYGDDRRIIPGRAKGYSVRDGEAINAPHLSMSVPHAAGGVFSTVDDLLRWDRALRAGEVIGGELLRRAWTPRPLPDGTLSGYGFGWKLCDLEGHATVEHGGFINGFGAAAIRFPDDGLNVIALANNDADTPDAGALARRLARFALTGSAEPGFVPLTPEQRAALVGRYEFADGEVREILERDDALWLRRSSGLRPLAAVSATELTDAEGDGALVLSFRFGADGRASKVRSMLRCEPAAAGIRIGP